jgi:hypothetical protein
MATAITTKSITTSEIDIHAVISFLWLKNYKPIQIHGEVCVVYREKTISKYAVEN